MLLVLAAPLSKADEDRSCITSLKKKQEILGILQPSSMANLMGEARDYYQECIDPVSSRLAFMPSPERNTSILGFYAVRKEDSHD